MLNSKHVTCCEENTMWKWLPWLQDIYLLQISVLLETSILEDFWTIKPFMSKTKMRIKYWRKQVICVTNLGYFLTLEYEYVLYKSNES